MDYILKTEPGETRLRKSVVSDAVEKKQKDKLANRQEILGSSAVASSEDEEELTKEER